MDTLLDHIRSALSRHVFYEKRMFGGVAFMVDEKMIIAVRGSGNLLVRVGRERISDLLAMPGVKPAEMGGRTQRHWADVAHEVLDSEEVVFWVTEALNNHATTA